MEHIPDDCLSLIFHYLDNIHDQESFGLTCYRWLQIQNLTRRSLHFHCSFSQLSISVLSQPMEAINSSHLFRMLKRFQNLRSLSLSGCSTIQDSSLTYLQDYGSKLQTLNLECCFGITDNGISLVACSCPLLTVVSLYRCNITDTGLETLAISCSSLQDVNLSYCSLVSDLGIKAILRNCHQVKTMKISYSRGITGIGFSGCLESLSYLEANSCKLEPEGILGIVSGRGLKYLDLSCLVWSIHGDGLLAVGLGFTERLRILNLRMCRTINDESVGAIAKRCPLLEEWSLALCHEVRVFGWESIGLTCRNLERLHVNRCRNLCDRGFQALRNGCRKLSVLYMNRCCRVSLVAIELFKCLRSDVEIREEEVMSIKSDLVFRGR